MNIQTPGLEDAEIEKTEREIGFWKRQFQDEGTTKQKVFDGIFGIFLPATCFFFDPVVFKSTTWGMGEAILGAYKPFAYLLSFVSVMALLAFMLWGKKLKWLNGFLSGLFAVGVIISLGIGVVLFPFSLLGLLIGIGVLGFTPLFTAFVFWRNSVRAFKTAHPVMGTEFFIRAFVLSAMFSLVLPSLANVKIQKGLETMKTADAQTIRNTAKRLKYVAPLVNSDSLAATYSRSYNLSVEQQTAIAESYRELTGKDIEPRSDFLND